MSNADDFVLASSQNPKLDKRFDVLRKYWVKINDSNQNLYTGTQDINFNNLQPISNSGLWWNVQESYITIPLVLQTVKTADDDTSITSDSHFVASLKNGFWSVVDSLRVSLANQQVIDVTRMSNVKISFEKIMDMSIDDQERSIKLGYIHAKNEPFIIYGNENNKYGLGTVQTSLVQTPSADANFAATGEDYVMCNTARLRRLKQLHWNPRLTRNALVTNANSVKLGRLSYVAEQTANMITVFYEARLQLSDLHSFFKHMPLSRNCVWDIQLSLHTNSSASTSCNAASKYINGVASVCPNGFCPIEHSGTHAHTEDGAGCGDLGATNTGYVSTLTVGKPNVAMAVTTYGAAPYVNVCQLHACMMVLSEAAESTYISKPVKQITYNESVLFRSPVAVGAGSQFSYIVAQGLSRLRGLMIVPYYDLNGGVGNVTDLVSPYSSVGAGYTSGPYCHITDLNVTVSGVQQITQNISSRSEFYEMYCQGVMNGGLDVAPFAGGVSFSDFNSQYGGIYVPLGRREASTDVLSQSVQVQFTNVTPRVCSYLIFVLYAKTINIDVSRGDIVL